MKQRQMNIQFPAGGENRRGTAAQARAPFTTPRAVNMRPVGAEERRGAGGTRPGLAKFINTDFGDNITGLSSVTYMDNAGVRRQDLAVIADGSFYIVRGSTVTTTKAYLTTDNGDKITDDNGNYLIFESTVASVNPLGGSNAFQMVELGGKLYIADSVLKRYDPASGAVTTVSGAIPGQPLMGTYQERLVLAGADHLVYFSALGDVNTWSVGGDAGDPARALALHLGDGGVIGGVTTCLLNWHDQALLVGTAHNLWLLAGNPAGEGSRRCVSPHVGVLSPDAICATAGGSVLFLAKNGLHVWQMGSDAQPEPFAPGMVSPELLDVDPATTDIVMEYDHRARGAHLFLTPIAGGAGSHWWIDLENRALWPVVLPASMQPVAAATLFGNVVLGCKDGYLRRFSRAATADDGTVIQSHLVIGPIHVSGNDLLDGMLKELSAALVGRQGPVEWSVFAADTAEETVDLSAQAVADELAGNTVTGAAAAGEWQ